MKNKIYAFLIGIMLVSTLFTGCGQNNEPSTDSKSEAENTDGSSVTESEADDTQNDEESAISVNLRDYITVNYLGYSGGGYVTLDINTDELDKLVPTEKVEELLKTNQYL